MEKKLQLDVQIKDPNTGLKYLQLPDACDFSHELYLFCFQSLIHFFVFKLLKEYFSRLWATFVLMLICKKREKGEKTLDSAAFQLKWWETINQKLSPNKVCFLDDASAED